MPLACPCASHPDKQKSCSPIVVDAQKNMTLALSASDTSGSSNTVGQTVQSPPPFILKAAAELLKLLNAQSQPHLNKAPDLFVKRCCHDK